MFWYGERTPQGHPRSSILTPIERVYGTSYWSSIVTLVISCPVLEIRAFFAESHFFHTSPLFQPKFRGVPFGVGPWCWGLLTANLIVKLFSKNSNLYDHDTSTSRTDDLSWQYGNTALYVASRCKNAKEETKTNKRLPNKSNPSSKSVKAGQMDGTKKAMEERICGTDRF